MMNSLKIIILTLITALLTGCAEEEDPQSPSKTEKKRFLVVNTRPGVSLRAGPSASAELLIQIPFGATVEGLAMSNTTESLLGFNKMAWQKVHYESTEGWVYSAFLNEQREDDQYLFHQGRIIKGLDSSTQSRCRQFESDGFPSEFEAGCFQAFGNFTDPDIDCMSDTHAGLAPDGKAHIELAHQGSRGRWLKANRRILIVFDSAYNLHYEPEDVPPRKKPQTLDLIHGQLIYQLGTRSEVAICMQDYHVATRIYAEE